MGPLLIGLYVFALAVFVGFEIITKIPPTLHTPLMSGANAVSGITVVGALYAARKTVIVDPRLDPRLCSPSIFAMVNVVGGFVVTDRMLGMFGPKKKEKSHEPMTA